MKGNSKHYGRIAQIFHWLSRLLLSDLGLSPANVTPAGIQDVTPRTVHDVVSKAFIVLFIMHLVGVFMYQRQEGDTFGRMGIPWFKGLTQK